MVGLIVLGLVVVWFVIVFGVLFDLEVVKCMVVKVFDVIDCELVGKLFVVGV